MARGGERHETHTGSAQGAHSGDLSVAREMANKEGGERAGTESAPAGRGRPHLCP